MGTTRVAALCMVAALALAACGDGGESSADPTGGDEPGGETSPPTGDTGTGGGDSGPIVVGGLFDMSGPTSDISAPYGNGVQAYFECLNENGGIDGRQVTLNWQDYQYDVATAEQLYTQYRADGAVGIVGWGTGDTEALRSSVAEDEIPFVSGAAPETITDPSESPYNFPLFTSYSDQLRLTLKWIDEREDSTAEVAVLHADNPFGTAPLEDGRAYVEDNGLDINYETYAMASGGTDFTGEIARISGQDPDYIYVQHITSPAAQLVRDLETSSIDPTVVVFSWAADELFIELAGGAAEGTYGVGPYAPASTDRPGHEVIRECAGDDVESVRFVTGWYAADILATGIRQVVASGQEVTGPAVKEALESMEPLDTGGVSASISYSEDTHKPFIASDIYVVEDGSWVVAEEGVEP